MFVKEKRDGRLKARLVTGGHRQDKSLYTTNDTSPPTVSTTALFLMFSVLTSTARTIY
jgi:hypothetical protein